MRILLLILFSFFFSLQLSLAQKTMYVHSVNGINLRQGPGTQHQVQSSIPHGSRIQVIDTNGDWAKVTYDGKTGYVSKQYLSENKPQAQKTGSKNSGSSKSSSQSSSSAYRNTSQQKNWGIGLRLGDPFGLSVKKYNRNKAWEFNIGRTSYWGWHGYNDAFYDYKPFKDYRRVDIRSAHATRALSIQAHHLWHRNFSDVSGLDWYYGVGGQLKSMNVRYRVRYEDQYGIWYDNVYRNANFIDIGVDGIIGLEYTFRNAPISLFADFNLFLELISNPFVIHGQAGIGARFNF